MVTPLMIMDALLISCFFIQSMLTHYNGLLTNLVIADGTEVDGKVVATNATYYSVSVAFTAILLANLLIGLTVRDVDKIGELADAAIIAVELRQIYEATASNALTCKAFNRFVDQSPLHEYLTLYPNKPEKRNLWLFWDVITSWLPEYVLQKEIVNKEIQRFAEIRFTESV